MPKPIHVRVLAVDDHPANLLALENVFRGSDLEIVKASSGSEALARLLEMEFACVLLDVKIPDIDGFELARIIRGDALTKHLPIIFVSGQKRDEGDIFRGYELGAVDYLTKPLDPVILRSKTNVFADLYRKEVARRNAVEELSKARDELETRVKERTAELSAQAEELARSNTELAQFAFISSHDLREPLRMISMYVQILSAEHANEINEEGKKCLGYVLEGATRMAKLIDGLLNYSRISAQDETAYRVDCNQVVAKVIETFRPEIEKLKGEIVVGPLPVAFAPEIQLYQLFQNLIENALKFRGDKPPHIEIRSDEHDCEYEFTVSDTGIGINPNYSTKIFEIFQRLHSREEYPGTGIGLSVCKKIVETNGGKIWVVSQLGQGATFHFTFPKRKINNG